MNSKDVASFSDNVVRFADTTSATDLSARCPLLLHLTSGRISQEQPSANLAVNQESISTYRPESCDILDQQAERSGSRVIYRPSTDLLTAIQTSGILT